MISIKRYIKTTISYLILLYDILRVLSHSKLSCRKLDINHKGSCFILGNGPSLKNLLPQIILHRNLYDIVCVNSFIFHDAASEVKPDIYILVDPVYFTRTASPRIEELKIKVLDAFNNKVSWKMKLIVPSSFLQSNFLSLILNPNISISCFNTIHSISNFKKMKFRLQKWGIASPKIQTVLHAALFVSINAGYKKIFLSGADSDSHTRLTVDQNTNELYYIDTHFYGEKKLKLWLDSNETIPSNLHKQLESCALVFETYWEIEYYSKYVGAKIYNISNNSWIDAYERCTIDNIINV